MNHERDFFSPNLRPEEEYEITVRYPPNESDGKINQDHSSKLAGEYKERATQFAIQHRKTISFEDLGVDSDGVSIHVVIAGYGVSENKGCHNNFLKLISATFPKKDRRCFKIVYLKKEVSQ